MIIMDNSELATTPPSNRIYSSRNCLSGLGSSNGWWRNVGSLRSIHWVVFIHYFHLPVRRFPLLAQPAVRPMQRIGTFSTIGESMCVNASSEECRTDNLKVGVHKPLSESIGIDVHMVLIEASYAVSNDGRWVNGPHRVLTGDKIGALRARANELIGS